MNLFDMLFGCWHNKYSFPISRRDGKRCATYICCLKCGKEFPYDWKEMRRVA